MNPEISITTERIDDFPLLLGVMIRLGLPDILDQHLKRHGSHQGLSWGWIAAIWLAHILTESKIIASCRCRLGSARRVTRLKESRECKSTNWISRMIA
jgi:transposase